MTVQAGGITQAIILKASLMAVSAQHTATVCLGCCIESHCLAGPVSIALCQCEVVCSTTALPYSYPDYCRSSLAST